MLIPARYFVLGLLLFFAVVSVSAYAQTGSASCGDPQTNCDEGNALSVCTAALEYTKEYRISQGQTPDVTAACTHPTGAQQPNGYFYCNVNAGGGYGCFLPGTTINQSTYYHTKLCTQRAPILKQVRAWSDRCVGGCYLEVKNGAGVVWSYAGTNFSSYHGDLVYTKACPSVPIPTPEDPGPPTPEECKPMGDLTMCAKDDGDQCITASSGKRFCFTPGESTNETSGNENVATAPTAPAPPNAPPADGTGWNPPIAPAPTVATTPTNGGSPTVVVVNVSTSVGSGSPPTGPPPTDPPPSGPPSPPTPPNPDPDGCDPATDPDCDDTAGGGETCETAPACAGDPINCQVLNQQWRARCAVEGSIAADGGCGSAAPACTGSKVLCEVAERERRHKCDVYDQQVAYADGLAAEAASSDGLSAYSESDIFGPPNGHEGSINEGLLGGSAGGSCPINYTLGGQPVELSADFWSLLAWVQWLVVAMAYLWAAQLVFK